MRCWSKNKCLRSFAKYIFPTVLALLVASAYIKYKHNYSTLLVKKDYYNYLCEQTKRSFFREEISAGKVLVRPNRKYAWDFSFSAEKEPWKKRIFIVGESVSYILHTPNGIFDNSKNPEFINVSMSGYDSERVAAVFSQALKYSPDLILIMTGNNETGDDPCLNSGFLKSGEGGRYSPREIFDRYEKNLRNMAAMAAERGVEFFLCSLPVNLIYPPYGELPFDPLFLKGFKYWLAGEYWTSARLFEKYLEANPQEPFGNYYLGLIFREMKDYKKARIYLEKAVSFDNRQDRASRGKNGVIRTLAGASGVHLIDLEAHLSRFSPGGIIDGTCLVDGVHWLDEEVRNDVQKFIVEQIALKTRDPGLRSALIELVLKYASPKKSAAPPGYEPVNYAVTYIGFNEKMDERIIYMLSRALQKGMISFRMSKEEVSSLLRDNLWIKIKKNSDIWWNNYLYYLAEVYLRKKDAAAALELLRKVNRASIGNEYMDKYNLAYMLACSGSSCSVKEKAVLSSYKFQNPKYKVFLKIFSEK